MNEPELQADAPELTAFERHKFLLLVGGTIIISLVLVSIALVVYARSGAEQLDLSRPGYQQVGKEITKASQEFDRFSPEGPLDSSVADKFLKLYNDESANVTKANAFGGEPLSKKSLSISDN